MAIEPGYKQLRTELIEPSPEQVLNFKLTAADRLLEIEKVFLADGDPIILLHQPYPTMGVSGCFSW